MHKSLQYRFGVFLLAAGFAYAWAEGPASAGAAAVDTASGKAVRESKVATGKRNAAVKRSKTAVRGSGKMHVEEPLAGKAINPDLESKAWQRSHAQGLTAEQKLAFRERKDKMGEMIALIKEKRMAMAVANPDERAVLARELHTLILEKDPETQDAAASARTNTGNGSGKKDGKKAASDDALLKKREMRELMEKRKEELKKSQKEKAKAKEK